jgi:hypothetical protein
MDAPGKEFNRFDGRSITEDLRRAHGLKGVARTALAGTIRNRAQPTVVGVAGLREDGLVVAWAEALMA